MNKEKITVTLSLADFDELRQSEKSYSRLYKALSDKLQKCFVFDLTAYNSELRRLDESSLKTDKEIFKAVAAAEKLISITVDIKRIKAIAVDLHFYDEDVNSENISKVLFKEDGRQTDHETNL